MRAKLQNFVKNISITIEPFININYGAGCEATSVSKCLVSAFSVVGFEYSGLRYLAGILSGRNKLLAYCRQETKSQKMPLPLNINHLRGEG